MKKILITGANSYIGSSFEEYIREHFCKKYEVVTMDMIDGSWENSDFSVYDAVFHVAGIAHRKETAENAHQYYEVNRDLAYKTAQKAKNEGVNQFVFLSSMSVYGMETGVITKETSPSPNTHYGKSKLEAEELLATLKDDTFRVCILRPPMVYGEGCKGNYQTIVKIVSMSPIFPKIRNRRSLIRIDNLVSFVEMAIDRQLDGLYFPQNEEYVCTMDLAKEIAAKKGKRLYYSVLAGFAVAIFRPFVSKLRKAFGDLVYEDTEEFDFSYCRK